MPKFAELPKPIFRLIKYPPQIAYRLGLGALIGRLVLLLTTTGRKSGQPRVTPLQYEQVGETIYLGASRGLKSDWVHNILADNRVEIQLKSRRFRGTAEVITDPNRIIEFLALRLRSHPRMVGAMLKTNGLSNPPTNAQLAAYAKNIALVIVTPLDVQGQPLTNPNL
jgi:deazaflavin-dependent oxidoreductase (nitroreductase family)